MNYFLIEKVVNNEGERFKVFYEACEKEKDCWEFKLRLFGFKGDYSDNSSYRLHCNGEQAIFIFSKLIKNDVTPYSLEDAILELTE